MATRGVSRHFELLVPGGFVFWAVLAGLAAGGVGPIRPVEAFFLLAPLVLVPLCLRVLRPFPPKLNLAALPVHVGALLAVSSFWLPTGPAAAALTGGWVAVCLLAAVGAIIRLVRGEFRSIRGVCANAGFIYLLVGSIWFALYRAGATPFGYPPATVFLASVHFHFSGCVLPSILAATLSVPPEARSRSLLALPTAIATFAGPAVLAAGNIRRSPEIKTAGAFLLVGAACGLAALALSRRKHLRTGFARAFLPVSVVSLLVGMSLVAVFAIGEVLKSGRLDVTTMGNVHGPVNAVGFALCALLAFAWEQRNAQSGATGATGPSGSHTAG